MVPPDPRAPATATAAASITGGVPYRNWLSLVILLVPIVVALSYRIRVEERALVEILEPEYAECCASTKRLEPRFQ